MTYYINYYIDSRMILFFLIKKKILINYKRIKKIYMQMYKILVELLTIKKYVVETLFNFFIDKKM